MIPVHAAEETSPNEYIAIILTFSLREKGSA